MATMKVTVERDGQILFSQKLTTTKDSISAVGITAGGLADASTVDIQLALVEVLAVSIRTLSSSMVRSPDDETPKEIITPVA